MKLNWANFGVGSPIGKLKYLEHIYNKIVLNSKPHLSNPKIVMYLYFKMYLYVKVYKLVLLNIPITKCTAFLDFKSHLFLYFLYIKMCT